MKVLKFGAIWCKECLVMKPMWAQIEAEMSELKTEYFDADENPELLRQYGIENIPVFIFLDNSGQEILRLQGVQNREKLVATIRENIGR